MMILAFALIFAVCFFYASRRATQSWVKKERAKQACEWNGGEPCPYSVRIGERGSVHVVEGSMRCCKVRQNAMKISRIVADGKIRATPEVRESTKKTLEAYKKSHPEEYKHLFGAKHDHCEGYQKRTQ